MSPYDTWLLSGPGGPFDDQPEEITEEEETMECSVYVTKRGIAPQFVTYGGKYAPDQGCLILRVDGNALELHNMTPDMMLDLADRIHDEAGRHVLEIADAAGAPSIAEALDPADAHADRAIAALNDHV